MSAKTVFILSVCMLAGGSLWSQQENVWAFGDHAGLDFTQGAPVPVATSMEGFGEGNASVCDDQGQLLFYTDGYYVWNKEHALMQNGNALTPIPSSNSLTPTSSTSQGALIMPVPGSRHLYYIWSLTSLEQGSNAGRLYYSVVDMRLDNGLGAVVSNQKGILLDSVLQEKMTAVVGDRCNLWLLVCSQNSVFKAYEITDAGVAPIPVLSPVGTGAPDSNMVGCVAVSPDRLKLAATRSTVNGGGVDGLILCDFDPATGMVRNPIQLLPTSGGYGTCFSPDNTKLYVNAVNGSSKPLYQFDVSKSGEDAIRASRAYLGPLGFSHLKLGPDGKIYFNSDYTGGVMGAIHSPNLSGSSADFQGNAIIMPQGMRTRSGLPNVIAALKQDTVSSVRVDTIPCFTSRTHLEAVHQDGFDYIWNDSVLSPQREVAHSGVYWVNYFTSPCTKHTDTFYITFQSGDLPTLHTEDACRGMDNAVAWLQGTDSITDWVYAWRDVGGNIISYSDTLENVPPGVYSLQISNAYCDTTLRVTLGTVVHRVDFLSDSLACIEKVLQLINTSHPYYKSFYWDFGDGTTDQQPAPNHSYLKEGSYNILLAGQGEKCSDTARRMIIVDKPFSAHFDWDKNSVCAGASIVFSARTDSSVLKLSWDWGDGSYLTTGTENTLIQHAFDQEGKVAVQLAATLRACPETDYRDTIRVNKIPSINLVAEGSLCDGAPIVVYNKIIQPAGHHWLWSDGTNADRLVVTQAGEYSCLLTSPEGCINQQSIVIEKECYLDIPNAFSPNGDGVNDYFFPRQLLSKDIKTFHMQVFSRWGQLVFESHEISGRGWNGNFNGRMQAEGIYVYKIQLDFNSGSESYEGNVLLIR